jgi:hypothetical protein
MMRQNRREEAVSFMDRKASRLGGVSFVPTLINARF